MLDVIYCQYNQYFVLHKKNCKKMIDSVNAWRYCVLIRQSRLTHGKGFYVIIRVRSRNIASFRGTRTRLCTATTSPKTYGVNTMKHDTVNGFKVVCYDAGEKVAERYTVLYLKFFRITRHGKLYEGRGMSTYPSHPQGIGMCCETARGRHNGKRIPFTSLPIDCQKVVINDLSGE